MTLSARFRSIPFLLLVLVTAGCGAGTGALQPQSGKPPATVTAANQSPATYVQIASTDLAVGENRFTFAIIDHDHPLKGGTPHVTLFLLQGPRAVAEGTVTARFNNFARGLRATDRNSAAVQIGGVYVTYFRFRVAGNWGMQVALRYGGHSYLLRQGFPVRRYSITPAIGSPAPRSHNPTITQEPATLLDSGRPPDDMHRLSIAAAIAQRKPLVVLFATAAYCTSRLCGPEIETVQGLEQRYRGRVNFVHIEIYKNADPQDGYAPAVVQWHLQSEPWVFVVDRSGVVRAKFEGPTPAQEIAPVLDRILR